MIIQPINESQQTYVRDKTNSLLQKAGKLYRTHLAIIPVSFDLKGRAAGMYRTNRNKREIRYNPYLFAKYFDDNLSNTIPHEVAHYVTDVLYGLINIRPHGHEWQSVMLDFGVKPQVTSQYDLSGIPVRQQRKFDYQCHCSQHKLSTVRHNRIQKNKARYHCRLCGSIIKPVFQRKKLKLLQLF